MKTKVYTYMIISNEAGNDHLAAHTTTSLSKNVIEEWHSEDIKSLKDRDSFIVKVFPIEEREIDLPEQIPQPIEHKIWAFFWTWHENPNDLRWTSDTELSVVQKKRKRLIDGWPGQIWVGEIKCMTDVQR